MQKPIPTDNEILFEGGIMITETDLKGRITYANRKFIAMTGYTRDELIGQPHSLIRHPDMPRNAFDEMWKTLREGFPWNGYVKNLTKDGSFYWVHVFITPRFDENGTINGYIAAREVPSKLSLEEVKKDYEFLIKTEGVSYRSENVA